MPLFGWNQYACHASINNNQNMYQVSLWQKVCDTSVHVMVEQLDFRTECSSHVASASEARNCLLL